MYSTRFGKPSNQEVRSEATVCIEEATPIPNQQRISLLVLYTISMQKEWYGEGLVLHLSFGNPSPFVKAYGVSHEPVIFHILDTLPKTFEVFHTKDFVKLVWIVVEHI